jgi:hypothetical protein
MPNLHEFDLKLAEEQKIKCCVKDQSETVVIRPFKSHSKLELCFYTKKKYWVCAKLHMMQVGCNTFVSHCNYWNQFHWGTSTPAMQSNGPLPQVWKSSGTRILNPWSPNVPPKAFLAPLRTYTMFQAAPSAHTSGSSHQCQIIYGVVVPFPQKRQWNIWSDYGRLASDRHPPNSHGTLSTRHTPQHICFGM